ncbi:MAG: DMT family transporter [Candidatus Komeilibacteria bacterium]|jgi:drug/metabolite transporter (DMT)-like permease|nr:DMT family transporter [Candidatus Komeilibacteria bacterium]
MDWLAIAIAAYLILAVVNLADKFLLENVVPSAKTYTFLVGAMGLIVIVIAPWFLTWPGVSLLLGNLLVGALFPGALLLLYRSLKIGDASKIIPLIGGVVPIFTILLAYLFLGERFLTMQWVAIIYLLLGTVMLAYLPASNTLWSKMLHWFGLKGTKNKTAVITAIAAGIVFAIFFVGSKFLYDSQPFLSSFIWIRIGTFLATLSLLIPRKVRKEIFHGLKSLKHKNSALFFSNQGIAAIGFLLQNYAIFLGSVAIVNALQGVQYAFLLVLGGLISAFFPKLLKENVSKMIIIQKILAVILISMGLYFII